MTEETTGAEATATEEEVLQPEAQVEEPQTTGDEAAAEPELEGEGERSHKPKKTAQDRFDELTRARREAEREAEYWRAKALESQKPPEPQAQPKQDAEPDPADYQFGETDARYIKDLAKYEARQELAYAFQAQRQMEEQTRVLTSHQQREAEFAKANPDYERAVYRPDLPMTPAMAEAILQSDNGPAIAYTLANDPGEARRISGLNPLAQALEIGRLGASLKGPAPQVAKTVSTAPAPPPQLRTARGTFAGGPRDDMSAEEWLRAREAQLGR